MLSPGKAKTLQPGTVITIGTVAILVHKGEDRDSSVWQRAHALSGDVGPTPPPSSRQLRAVPRPIGPHQVITRDPKMRSLYEFAKQVAQSNVRVLILGETGVGKELLARAIHDNSPRRRGPLVTLNCAAIPESLFESELFGYERGAFSGALSSKPGLFEAAHGSTIFLDEVAELPANVQPKLLRVLETGEVLRLGAVRPIHVDVRVVSATNRDLRADIVTGAFRADLFYRLNGISLSIPALRERAIDILELAQYFVADATGSTDPRFTPGAIEALCAYSWPGNVRELRSVIERAALLAQGGIIDVTHLLFEPPHDSETLRHAAAALIPDADTPTTFNESMIRSTDVSTETVLAELARLERRQIEEALERTGGNQKDAAKLLGISRRTLIRRLDRYRLTRPRKRQSGPTDA
jgi:transcriptional regulator with GAF, ATPase, and Fis domain